MEDQLKRRLTLTANPLKNNILFLKKDTRVRY